MTSETSERTTRRLVDLAGCVLDVDGQDLVPFTQLEASDLGDLQGECLEEGEHNPSYRVSDGSSRPPPWAEELRSVLRKKHGRKRVGKVLCHVAECDGCRARAFRYGVVVRIELGDGLAIEREYGEPRE